jgi:hypothetical protein
MSEPTLDWGSAAVADGELVVGIDGELPKGWKASFEATAQLLSHGGWKPAKVKKGSVHVGGVSPGDEDRLRHFLESAIQQANADSLEQDDDADDDADDEDAADPESESETSSESEPDPDAEMTARFRSFSGG